MGDHSAIQWTDATWNPVAGCTRVSAGCDNCYAARLSAVRLKDNPTYRGLAVITPSGRAAFNGRIRLLPDRLDQPLRWRKPRRVFVNSMSDLFHEGVPFDFIDKVFNAMAAGRHHIFQVLTKRPERAAWYLAGAPRVLPNVWIGTSVEGQAVADERIPHLLRTPAAVRFLSCEPLLGPIDFEGLDCWPRYDYRPTYRYWRVATGNPDPTPIKMRDGVDWVIVGGESGPGARPMQMDWVRPIRDQCQEAGVAFFFKQVGGHTAKAGGRLLDGREWDEMPEEAA